MMDFLRGLDCGKNGETTVMIGNSGNNVTNGAIVIHTQRLKSDPGGNLLS